MKVTITDTTSGRVVDIEVEPTDPIEDSVAVIVEAEFGIPMHLQQLSIAAGGGARGEGGQPPSQLSPMGSLQAQGVGEGSHLTVSRRGLGGGGSVVETTSTQHSDPHQVTSSSSSSSAVTTPHHQQAQQVSDSSASAPNAAAAASSNTSNNTNTNNSNNNNATNATNNMIADLFAQSKAQVEERKFADKVAANPDDPEVQRKMYEAIQRSQLEENITHAMEYTPEAFSRVIMLYVKAEVNGVKLNAFVDSGAQMTIMSARIAEQCNLTRLIDKRFSGLAKGVGTSKIIGRVHLAQVNLGGGHFLPMSITVLEQNDMDFLLGLDQLKRHQMAIDLKKNALMLDENTAIPFLPEHELDATQRGGDGGGEAGGDADGGQSFDPDGALPKAPTPPPGQGQPSAPADNDSSSRAASAGSPPAASAAATTSGGGGAGAGSSSSTTTSGGAPPPTAIGSGLTPERRQAVESLIALSGGSLDPTTAVNILEAAGWNVDAAAGLLFQ